MTPKVLLLLALYAVSILGDDSALQKFILSFNENIDGMVCHYISDHSNESMIYNCHTTSLVNSSDNSSVSEMHFIEISGFIRHNQEEESEYPDEEHLDEEELDEEHLDEEHLDEEELDEEELDEEHLDEEELDEEHLDEEYDSFDPHDQMHFTNSTNATF